MGDPIKIKALTEAFGTFTRKRGFCALGSHKPNIGHTIMTAGIAGVFKILLGMQFRQIPPTIGVDRLNRHLDLADSPFSSIPGPSPGCLRLGSPSGFYRPDSLPRPRSLPGRG